jgi:hypothetical protein
MDASLLLTAILRIRHNAIVLLDNSVKVNGPGRLSNRLGPVNFNAEISSWNSADSLKQCLGQERRR